MTQDLARKVTALVDRNDVVHLPNSVDSSIFRPEPPSPDLRQQLGIEPGGVSAPGRSWILQNRTGESQ